MFRSLTRCGWRARGANSMRVTTAFDWKDRYNLSSGIIGGAFLALAYFGTDQSQVQRYLTGKSIGQSRLSLLFNATFKVPIQFFILFIGAMVFVFFLFERPPLLFHPVEMEHCGRAPSFHGSRRVQPGFRSASWAAEAFKTSAMQ